MNIFRHPRPPKWSASLCGCANDLGTCCITWHLPCITFGQIAEIVDEGNTSCAKQGCLYCLLMMCSCHCLLSCVYREKLRAKFDLPAKPCNDCCVHFCCESCALCQEHAELKNRGFHPSEGWNGPPTFPLQMPSTMRR